MENYHILHKLGEGGQGCTYRAINKRTCQVVVIKNYITSIHYGGKQVYSAIANEISSLTSLRHPLIVKLQEVVLTKRQKCHYNIWMVLESLDCDLDYYLHRQGIRVKLSPSVTRKLCYNMLSALKVCHENGYVHRDVKPGNLLINRSGLALKLADFGHSASFANNVQRGLYNIGTLPYRAPELVLGASTYTSAVDIWSAGCVFAEMLIRGTLFPCADEESLLSSMIVVVGFPGESELGNSDFTKELKHRFEDFRLEALEDIFPELNDLGPHGLQLLKQMLQRDPRRRISAAKALQSKYFREFRY